MKMIRIFVLSAAVLGTSWTLGMGCDAVDTAFDCAAVCERYHDCYDATYDESNCRSKCRTAAKNDPAVEAKADACEACIGDRSCLSATFACGADCGAIVP